MDLKAKLNELQEQHRMLTLKYKGAIEVIESLIKEQEETKKGVKK